MLELEPISVPENLTDTAYKAIKRLILSRPLEPGFKLTEARLARELAISKTPVREALKRLEAEGLVDIHSRHGAFVVQLSPKSVRDIYDLREALEVAAVRLAIQRATNQALDGIEALASKGERYARERDYAEYNRLDILFHDALVRASDNKKLHRVYQNLHDQIQMVRLRTVRMPGRPMRSFLEHKRLVQALRDKDLATAEEVMRSHVQSVKTDMLAALEKIETEGR